MAWNDFYMITGTGSNLNSGSTSSGSATYTSSSGNWGGTSTYVFTPTDGSTPSSSVNVGDWVSIYTGSPSATSYIAQVTAVGSGTNGTITVSSTNFIGTVPTSGSGTFTLKDGGAWADFGIVTGLFTTGTVAVSTRVNIKAGTYANTSTSRTFLTAGSATAPLWWRGYETTPGDQDGNNAAVAGTNIPALTWTTGQMSVQAGHNIFSNLDISGACTSSGGQVYCTSGSTHSIFYGVRVQNTAAAANARAISLNGTTQLVRCYLKATTIATTVVYCAGANDCLSGCTITGGIIGCNATSNPARSSAASSIARLGTRSRRPLDRPLM